MNRVRLTGGANAVISVDLQHHVGEPHCCLTGWVAHTRQKLTAGGTETRQGETGGANMLHLANMDNKELYSINAIDGHNNVTRH